MATVGLETAEIIENVRRYFKSPPAPAKKPKQFMELVVSAAYEIENTSPLSYPHLKSHGLTGMLMGPRKLENKPDLLAYIQEHAK